MTLVLTSVLLMGKINASALDEVKQTEYDVTVKQYSKDLSYEEAVELLMEKKEVSREEAEKLLGYSDNVSTHGTNAGETAYREYVDTYVFANRYEVEIGGLWKVYSYGSFRQFDENVSCWTAATGSGNYTWDEIYVQDTTESYPAVDVSVAARGVVEVAVDHSTTIGLELGSELLGFGFTFEDVIGDVKYYRHTANMTLTRSCY